MKKQWSVILLIVVFLVGLSLLLYPSVSNTINLRHQSQVIAGYEKDISNLKEADYSAYFRDAEAYNKELGPDSLVNSSDADKEKYNKLLNPANNGIMGYIEINKIGVKLAIYHGTDNAVLQVGVGHIEGSSLPVGGPSTHSVLSGHRGLPSSQLFTDLDQLAVGDVFLLHILGQVLAYQVDQILIVEPDNIQPLGITEGKDYCTLVTCTPYGINTQRLLVRGVRVDYKDNPTFALKVSADAKKIEPILVAPAVAAPILIILFIWLLVSTNRKTSGRKKRR